MKIHHFAIPTLLIACLPLLAACSSGQSNSGGVAGALDHAISNAMDKAQEKLQSEPITVSNDTPNLPKAAIAPNGDFLVAGKPVAINPAQRKALLEYRGELVAIATQGMQVGKQGAALGIQAATAAISGAMAGKSGQEIKQSVQAQTSDIRQAAAAICNRLPALMAEQQQLAAALPAFEPYATMTQADVDDCIHDATQDDADRAQTRAAIRERIRTDIRNAVQGAGLASSKTEQSGTATPATSTTPH